MRESQPNIEPIMLSSIDLERYISTIEFFEGPPHYMTESRPSYAIENSRFTVTSLQLLYRQFRANQEDTRLMDMKTF